MIKRDPESYLNLQTGDEYVFFENQHIRGENNRLLGPGDKWMRLFDSAHGYFVFEIIAQYGMTYQCIFLGISQGDGFGIEPIGPADIPTIKHRYGHLPKVSGDKD